MDSEIYHFFIDFSLFTYYLSCDEGLHKSLSYILWYLLPKSKSSKTLRIRIPSSEKYAANFVFRDYAISVLTNGSKVETDTAFEIFTDDLHIPVSLSLLNVRTDFQAEIYKIIVAAKSIKQFFFVH